MFLDLISTDNQISCNVQAAQLLGLEAAVYVNELINIYAKAISKSKLDEQGYFKLQRRYITTRTTLTPERQLELDSLLQQVEVLHKDVVDPDSMFIDVDMYASLLSDQSPAVAEKIQQLTRKKPRGDRTQAKRNAIVESLKRSVECSNEELRQAYYDWIESVYSKPTGFLSKGAIKVFKQAVDNYAKGDLDVALDLLRIATMTAYKNIDRVINLYTANSKLRSTQQRIEKGNVQLSDLTY